MSINTDAYKHAAYPPPMIQPTPVRLSGARRLIAHWNNAKSKIASQSKHAWQEAEGVLFSNGRVAIDYGPCYASMSDLEETLRRSGDYRIEFVDA